MTAGKSPRKKVTKVKAPVNMDASRVTMEALDLNAIPVSHLSDEQISECMRNYMARLMERCELDTVRICATSVKDGATHYYSVGNGNIYAQIGAVQEWMNGVLDTMDGMGLGGMQGPMTGEED